MAHPSASTLPSEDDFYLSDIITGAHGDKYQKDLAMLMFERATRKEYDFKLGYEMAIADKFDDVAYFDKIKNEWTLIQTKHADTSKGKPPPLKFEMLFPKDEGTREKGDFSLFKYLKSYLTVKVNIKERTNVVIFTNRDLEQSVIVEPRQVDEIFLFEHAKHVGLMCEESLIQELIDFVNRDFNSLRNSIIKLFKEGVMDKLIENFKTPVASILTVTNANVRFLEKPSPEVRQILDSLSGEIDIRTAQLSLEKCKNLFTGRSRNKTLPICANKDIVRKFFQNITLFVAQPDDLRANINQDIRKWMRTWIRPNYLTRMEDSQLEMSTVNLEAFFDDKQSQVRKGKEIAGRKKFLNLNDGQVFFDSAKSNLEKQIQKMSNYNVDDWKEYYISRQVEYVEPSDKMSDRDGYVKKTIRDEDLVNELSGVFKRQGLLLLIAEPGMGKSIILEYIAMIAQQKTDDCVYHFNLNTFNQKFKQVSEGDSFGIFSPILKTMLSKSNFDSLSKLMDHKDNKSNYFIILDALDEVFPQHRDKVLKIISQMMKASNMKIILSTRKTMKTEVEKKFGVKSMSLVPFNEQDKMNFLRKFWKVSSINESKFCKYVKHLFKIFHSDINQAIQKFVGLPLMLKMLAEVYNDHFEKYLHSTQNNLEKLIPQQLFSTVKFYGQFVKKCFTNKMMKKYGNSYQDSDEELEPLLKKFTLEHQLLAIKYLPLDIFKNIFQDENYVKILNVFESRIKSGEEKSSLVESIGNDIKFVHQSYAEFLVADFIFDNFDKYENEIFCADSDKNFASKNPLVGIFFFAILEEQFTSKHIAVLEKRNEETEGGVVYLACKMQNLKIVECLLRTKCDSTITNQLLSVGAEHDCYSVCSNLLENHQVVVDYRVNGCTPLQRAAEIGHTDIVKLLIDNSSDVNSKNNNGRTPLHLAAKNGHLEEIKLLTAHSGNVNEKDNSGCTPLHIASENNQPEVVETLVNSSADTEEKNNCGETPLHIAARRGHCKISQILINKPPLQLVSRNDCSDMEKAIIEKCTDVVSKENGWTPLHYAAIDGNSEIVKKLVDKNADINAQNKEGWTPLHYAASYGHSEVVSILINKHADINKKDNEEWTPLHLACQNGHLEVVKILIDRDADINAKTNKRKTALHFAASNGHSEVVTILIDKHADINAKDNEGWTPLCLAADKGYSEVVKILIDRDADFNTQVCEGWTPLHLAAGMGHSEVVKILIDRDADINAKSNNEKTPLHLAAGMGHSEVVKILIDRDADINAKSNNERTPLLFAAFAGHLDVVKIVIDRDGDFNAKVSEGWTPLHFAAGMGHLEVGKILIDRDAGFIAKVCEGWTPLHFAADMGHSEVVKILIDKHADINAKDNKEWTPLHLAAHKGHSEVVKILIDRNADLNAETNKGWTPLHFAAGMGHSEVVKKLVDKNADINAKGNIEMTPLHLAAFAGHTEVVKILIDRDADINAKDNEGWTPLHLAAFAGHTEVVKILIDRDADINAKDNEGWTPLHRACQNGHSKVVKILIDKSADIDSKTNEGWTPLQLATQNGYMEIVKILTDNRNGIYVNTTRTPSHQVSQSDHTNVDQVTDLDNDTENPLQQADKKEGIKSLIKYFETKTQT